jgi:carbamoyl-phosphate synthase small subunit
MAAIMPQQLGLLGRLQRSQQHSLAHSSHASAQPRAAPAGQASGSGSGITSGVAGRPAAVQLRAGRRRLAVLVRAEAAAAPWKPKDTRLVLEDGTVLTGTGFGAQGTAIGEVVFNTSLTVG